MAWGGIARSTAAVITTVVLLAVSGCAGEIDQAHGVQTRLGRLPAVAAVDVDVTGPDRGARIAVRLSPGLDDAAVLALVAAIEAAASREAYPSYRLELREGGADTLVVDDAFATDRRAAAVVAAWRRTASALLGAITLTYEGRRTSVRVRSDGGLANDVAETARIAPPPGPVVWRFESGAATVLLGGRVGAADLHLVERVQRGVGSPSLPVTAGSWRLVRHRTQIELDLRTDLGGTPAETTTAAWGERLAPLAQAAAGALGRPRQRLVLRLLQAEAGRTDAFAWWTSGRDPAPGRDRLNRGWDAWLAAQARALAR